MTRRRVLMVVAALLLAAGALGGLAGRSALRAADALERARADLTSLDPGGTSLDEAGAVLAGAREDLRTANADLGHWSVDVVAALPVVGRSWDVERAVARTASHVVDGASVLADQLPTVPAQSGRVDLTALEVVEREVDRSTADAQRALAELRDVETALTPGRVRAARVDAVGALTPVVDTLARATEGLRLVRGLLGASGDRTVLIALQNNAELRGTGGYVSTFAIGRTSQGRFSIGPVQDVVAVADPPEQARRVPAPEEYAQDYGPLSGDTTIWRSWNMSPHVPDSALVGARVAGALLGGKPDVVVLVDVPAMARLAELSDGVVLPDGSRVSSEELSKALLVDSYEDAGQDFLQQTARKRALQSAATTAIAQLLAGDLPLTDVVRTVADLSAGRHVTLWSARPDEQASLVDFGAAGGIEAAQDGDLSHVSVNNVGSNKLDVHVDREVSVEATVGPSEASVVQRVAFTNRAPDGLVGYVAGTERPGTAISRIELSLPPTATDVVATLDGRTWPGRIDRGASRYRLPVQVDTPRGASTTVEVRYRLPLPDGTYRLRVIPQPLARDATVRVALRAADGGRLTGDGVDSSGSFLLEGPLLRTEDVDVRLSDVVTGRP